MAAVGATPVPWTPSGWSVGVASSLGRITLLWMCGRSLEPRLAAVRRGWSPGPSLAAPGCVRSPGPRMVAVEPFPVPRAPYCRRVGVARPLSPVWPLWKHGRTPAPRMAAVGE